VATEEELVEI